MQSLSANCLAAAGEAPRPSGATPQIPDGASENTQWFDNPSSPAAGGSGEAQSASSPGSWWSPWKICFAAVFLAFEATFIVNAVYYVFLAATK